MQQPIAYVPQEHAVPDRTRTLRTRARGALLGLAADIADGFAAR